MTQHGHDQPYESVISMYEGTGTTHEAFEQLRIRAGNGVLENKGHAAIWKGGMIGHGIGLPLGGPA